MSRFSWVGEVDDVLQRAGITREKLRALEGDDEICAAMETRRDAACNTPWRFEHPVEADAEFFTAAFAPLIHQITRNAWEAVPYGCAVQEVVYRQAHDPASPTPGYIGLHSVVSLPFEWARITPLGEPQWSDTREPMDPRKFFATVREGKLRKPNGESLLSRLYWPWFFRSHGWKFWLKFLERCSVPFLMGKTNSDKTSALNALSQAVQDAVAVMGTEDSLEALDMGSAKVDFNEFETAVVRRYQRLILGQTLTSGTDGGSGNRALGQVHNEVRLEKKQADCRLICETVQRIANMLAALNGIQAPVFCMEDGTGLERERAERDQILVRNGMVQFSAEYIQEKYSLGAGDFTIPQKAPMTGAAPDDDEGRAARLAARFADSDKPERRQFTAGQQLIEDRIEASVKRLPSPIDDAAIRGAIRAARDADDLVDRLGVVLRDADRTTFAAVLERAMFAADVMGYAHAGAAE